MPALFRQYFKEIAEAETRSITLFEGNESGLPPGEYGFVEFYCDEKNCDCRRVHLMVVADWNREKPLAMLGFGWESPKFYDKWMHGADKKMAEQMAGVSLEPFFAQTKYAPGAKKLCENVLLADPNYVERLKQHYRMMRDRIDGRQHTIQIRNEKRVKRVEEKKSVMIPPKERIAIPELIPTETVREALLSPNEAVRNSASYFFTFCRTEGLTAEIMKTVIQSVELYGKIASLGVLSGLDVPQDETTVRWLTQELDKEYDLENIHLDNYCYFLTQILCKADPKLLTSEMSDLRCFSQEKKPLLFKRLELASLDWAALWKIVLHYAADIDGLYESDDYDLDDLLVEAVVRHEECQSYVLDALGRKNLSLDDADFDDFVPLLLRIVAKKHIKGASDFVFDAVLNRAEQYPSEGYWAAFSSLAEDDDWERLYSRWQESPDENWWFIDLLMSKPSTKRLEIVLDIVRTENKGIKDEWLVRCLLENYVKEAHPAIANLLDREMMDSDEWEDHVVGLTVSGIVNPDSLEDFDIWFEAAEEAEWNLEELHAQHAEEREREIDSDITYDDEDDFDDEDEDWDDETFDSSYGLGNPLSRLPQSLFSDSEYEDESSDDSFYGPQQPFRREEPKVGRNDPCPCGSGKKYKKCCLKT